MTGNNPPTRSKIYPWVVWVIAACFLLYKYLLQVSPSVMTSELMRAFHINATWLGNLSACFFYTYLLMQIPVGVLLDRYSPRRLTSIAIFICGFATLCFAENTSFFSASVTRALMGVGGSFAAVSCFQLAAIWFPPKRFALVTGMSMTAAMFGAIGGQLPLSMLVQSMGWRHALYLIGLFGVLLSAIYFICVRDRKSAKPTKTTQTQGAHSIASHIKHVLQNKQAIWLSLYSGLAFAPVTVFGGLWGVPFLKTAYQVDASTAAILVSFVFIGFAFGAPILGWLSDHMGKRKPILFYGTSVALFSLTIVIYGHALSFSVIAFLLFVFGFSASGYFTSFAMVREQYTMALVATAMGLLNTFNASCEALLEPFVGALLDWTWSGVMDDGVRQMSLHGYHIAFSLFPLALFFALVALYFVEETYCRGFESSHQKNDINLPQGELNTGT